MLRHRKKHGAAARRAAGNNTSTGNSASDISDEESQSQTATEPPQQQTPPNIPNLISKDLIWKLAMAQREQNNRDDSGAKHKDRDGEDGSDLIGNLLGISDRGILNKLLSSADEAAKLLGVKNSE